MSVMPKDLRARGRHADSIFGDFEFFQNSYFHTGGKDTFIRIFSIAEQKMINE
ncbi:hypothetical protein LEP1GSC050_0400 [Leptospira broomii serovar Hurstbridge str. 5399]|uniref:Uncharacterized protein n=1 Tax=Leptospira broomii serovar Hurstbridge str. 5399 TaxID=1049789 RepID=T0FGD3_9LEPT|nr:hypothetical protein LEP1GSC050_0400 [Leptospira broomii serovar Hurstbridge str. 5399]